jgi:hypothetical protein
VDDKIIKTLGLSNLINQEIQINKLANSFTPKYDFIRNINEPVNRVASEVIEEEEEDLKEYVDFENSQCKICNKSINSNYYWYYLKNTKFENKSFSTCCLKCLKEYQESNPYEIDNYEIIEYNRCTAYYKCKELNNLRGKCELSKNLTAKDIFTHSFVNFCESSQAGVILSTYKMNEILKEFSEQSKKQYTESNNMLKTSALQNKQQFEESSRMVKESGIESKRQFNITSTMTILVIILTIVNITIAVLTYGNNDSVVELKKLSTKMTEINENLNTIKTQNNTITTLKK